MRKALLAAAVVALLASAAPATVLKKLTLGEIEGYASEIFTGTVQAIDTFEGDGPRKLIYTEVTFHELTSLKGKFRSSTATYRFAGGVYGERKLRVVGMPEFRVGQRCLLFTNATLDKLCPVVGWWQGRYLLIRDKDRKVRVHDSQGKPVYGIRDGRPVLEKKTKDAKPMLESDLLKVVRAEIALGEIRRRKQREAEKGGER
jgi:hypothetical protein